MGMHYCPIAIMILIMVINISIILKRLYWYHKNLPIHDEQMRRRYRCVVLRTILFVMSGIFTWTPGTVNRLWQYTSGDKSPYTVVFLHMLFAPAHGVINFFIYVFPLVGCRCLFICNFRKNVGRVSITPSPSIIIMQDEISISTFTEIDVISILAQSQTQVEITQAKPSGRANSNKNRDKYDTIEMT